MLYKDISQEHRTDNNIKYVETIGGYDLYKYVGRDYSYILGFPEWITGAVFAYRGEIRRVRLDDIFVRDGALCKHASGNGRTDENINAEVAPIVYVYNPDVHHNTDVDYQYIEEYLDGIV